MDENNGERAIERSHLFYLSNSQEETCDISIYSGGELTGSCVAECMRLLKDAYPNMTAGFYRVLSQRIKANNFSDARLRDAIGNLIDNNPYPEPTIANIISFDQRVKLLNYHEMIKQVDLLSGNAKTWEFYTKIQTPWGVRWVKNEDYDLIKHRYD